MSNKNDNFLDSVNVETVEDDFFSSKKSGSLALEKTKNKNNNFTKGQKRKPMSISVHDDVREALDKFCEDNAVNKSVFTENFLRKFLTEKGYL